MIIVGGAVIIEIVIVGVAGVSAFVVNAVVGSSVIIVIGVAIISVVGGSVRLAMPIPVCRCASSYRATSC